MSRRLVGRGPEVARVRRVIAGGGVAALVGPAGIGKSAIASAALAQEPHAVGRGLSTLRRRPYASLEPVVRGRLAGEPETVAEHLLEQVEGVLLVEDLHWLHGSALAAVSLLVGRLPMVVTTRPSTSTDLQSFLDRSTAINVNPLSPSLAEHLARGLHPHLDPTGRARLLTAAGGSPLLLKRLVDVTGNVSPTLVDAISDRMNRLDARARRATELVALLGRPADARIVPELDGFDSELLVPTDDVRIQMSHAVVAAVVVELIDADERRKLHRCLADRLDDAEGAAHDLAAENFVRAAERAERAAAASVHAEERAELLQVAAAATDALACDARRLRVLAAEAFVDAGRWQDAIGESALVREDGSLEASDALFHQARARWNSGDVETARALLARAERLASGRDPERAARVTIERAYLEVRDRTPGATAMIRTAVDGAVEFPSEHLRARASFGAALLYDGDPEWERVLRDALTDAGTESELAATIAYHLISGLGFHGRLSEALEIGRQFAEHTAQLGLRRWTTHFEQATLMHRSMIDPAIGAILSDADAHLAAHRLFRNRFLVHMVKVLALLDLGRFDAARDAIGHLEADCSGEPEQTATVAAVQGELAWHTDDPELARAALELGRPVANAYFGMHLLTERTAAHVLVRHGEPVEPVLPTIAMPVWWPALHELEGLGHLAAGDAACARIELQAAADHWEAMGINRWAVRAGMLASGLSADAGHRAASASRRHYVQLARASGLVGTLRQMRRPVHPSLTLVEETILREVACGSSTRIVAERLHMAPLTVDQHVESARRKLGAATRLEAALLVEP